jgi:hypothetical protein
MNKLIACLVLGGLVSAPAMASVRTAAYSQSSDMNVAQPSMFAGATYRVGFDRKSGTTTGRASVKIAGMTATRETGGMKFAEGIALTGGKTGKPALHLAGLDIDDLERRSNLSTGATIAIGVGVVLLVGAVIIATTKPWECYSDGAPCD